MLGRHRKGCLQGAQALMVLSFASCSICVSGVRLHMTNALRDACMVFHT